MALILLIDDDHFYRRIIEQELKDAGFAVASAATGSAGIARYRELAPDVVITDMRMPGMGGGDVIRSIRAIDKQARIIATSGIGTSQAVDFFKLARQAGADTVVRKLDPMERLIIEVRALL
jgi:CheY-like chemotaxis protein